MHSAARWRLLFVAVWLIDQPWCWADYIPPVVPISGYDGNCSRLLSREAAAIFDNEVLPTLSGSSGLALATGCPLNSAASIYADDEHHKHEVRAAEWQCTYCGSTFRSERYVDFHIHLKHSSARADARADNAQSTCLANYCGILGCPSLSMELVDPDLDLPSAIFDFDAPDELTQPPPPPAVPADAVPQLPGGALDDTRGMADATEKRSMRGVAQVQPPVHTHDAAAIHRTQVTGVMSSLQASYRARCRQVFTSCIVLPSTSPLSQTPSAAGIDSPGGKVSLRGQANAPEATPEQALEALLAQFCDDSIVTRTSAGGVDMGDASPSVLEGSGGGGRGDASGASTGSGPGGGANAAAPAVAPVSGSVSSMDGGGGVGRLVAHAKPRALPTSSFTMGLPVGVGFVLQLTVLLLTIVLVLGCIVYYVETSDSVGTSSRTAASRMTSAQRPVGLDRIIDRYETYTAPTLGQQPPPRPRVVATATGIARPLTQATMRSRGGGFSSTALEAGGYSSGACSSGSDGEDSVGFAEHDDYVSGDGETRRSVAGALRRAAHFAHSVSDDE